MQSTAQNIILTGFMGTGKSTIGRLVAARLGREFIDMDSLIEQREGRAISRIFAESGEAYFRQLEAELCRELSGQNERVIATGGGTLVPEQNLRLMEQNGLVICLDCEPETLWQRIGQSEDRPMLAARDEERFTRLAELLARRTPAYRRIRQHLDVTRLSPEEAAKKICEIYRSSLMDVIEVTHPGGSYPIYLGQGVLAETGRRLSGLGYGGRCAVVTNETVGRHHAKPLLAGLQAAGFEPVRLDLPDGEQFKTLATVAGLYGQLVEAGLDRRSPIIALGGGVLGDTVGFAAASYLRGVPFVQIPTTLLSMVDASVGGKVGVDLPQGKNLVGAFKQPEMVMIDPNVLASLPPAEFRAGLAEVVKHGIIGAPDLFAALENGGYELDQILFEAILVKVQVVQEDPFEQGRRAVLNLGHTFAHAFERLSRFELRHGEAVAMGLACAARLSTHLGHCSQDTAGRIVALLGRLELPAQPPPYTPDEVWAAMATDKKRQGQTLRFVLPRAIGDVDIFQNVTKVNVKGVLSDG